MSDFNDNTPIYKHSIKNFSNLFKNDSLKNVTFMFENSDIKLKAHKLILVAASPVFAAMFSGNFVEDSEVKITDIEPDIFELLLRGIYLDELKFDEINIRCAAHLFYAAEKYDINDICSFSENILKRRCAGSNVQFMLKTAKKFNLPDLEEACKKSFKQGTYRSLSYYLSFDVNDDDFSEFFALEGLSIKSEYELYLAVEVMYELNESKNYPKCLSQIRFFSMEIRDILTCDLLTAEEKFAVIENIEAFKKHDTATIPMPSRLSSETKSRAKMAFHPIERKQFWTALMLKCRDYKKYLERFYKQMEISQESHETTEALIKIDRSKAIDIKNIKDVAKSIFNY